MPPTAPMRAGALCANPSKEILRGLVEELSVIIHPQLVYSEARFGASGVEGVMGGMKWPRVVFAAVVLMHGIRRARTQILHSAA